MFDLHKPFYTGLMNIEAAVTSPDMAFFLTHMQSSIETAYQVIYVELKIFSSAPRSMLQTWANVNYSLDK